MTPILGLGMGEPARYRILVRGRLPTDYSSRLEGMHISTRVVTQGETVSMLVGELRDQAALAGVLTTLYEFRMPILSARCLGRR